jgi:5-methylcytosine-specific restriction enzyme A
MGKITNDLVESSFEIGKKVYRNELTLKEGIQTLTQKGMNRNSANDYIYNYSNLIQGKLFTRTSNTYATEYFLERIYRENGLNGLQNALLSLSQHIEYYEEKSGAKVKSRRKIYTKYFKLIGEKIIEPIYPDEVDPNIKYAEGKTKKVTVNSYERNSIARKRCIEHYGLNCQVCGFNFKDKFDKIGKDFIHVHHKVDIALIGNEYSVDPIKDLIPVCPNCHSMLHKRKPAYSIEELKNIINE